MANIPIAIQLYTVRDLLGENFKSTVEKIAEMGYKGVELAGDNGGMNATELKAFLDGLGLKVAGSHTPIEQIVEDVQPAIDFALEVGNKFVVCPYLGDNWRENAEGYIRVAKILEEAGAKCKEAGIQMCYHNHSFEFIRFDGEYGFDILYANSDPELVQLELDTYWVKDGGEDPVEYINKYSGRVPLIHLKDMRGDESRSFAEVGAGILDMNAIFEAAEKAGTKWYIVEQDVCPGSPLDSAKISIDNLKKMGVA